ncbi:MAG: trypsin-like peptidase domain-containing protein [Aestuariibaculum sp.]
MKKILSLILVSVLGGIITLGAYKLFLEPKKNTEVGVTATTPSPNFLPASNVINTASFNEAPDFTIAAENTVNAVVHVKNVSISRGGMSFEDLFYGRSPQRAQMGTGSGVIVNADGYIVTNNHVISNSNQLTVTLNNNKTYEAQIVGTDPKTDIALLKIDANEDLPYVTFADSDQVRIGEWVLAVGNPFNLTSTVTAGIVSAKARDLSGNSSQSFIQTDAAVNPGNSGGALVNTKGELIGINTAISSQTGSYVGYSFAVPSNIARRIIEDIMEYGNVQNGILGISGGELNSNASEKLGITDTEGIYISEVIEDSGADEAGIEEGDIIKEIDNIKISKFSDLTGHISAKRAGDVVSITISKNGKLKTVPVKLTKNQTLILPVVGTVKNANKNELKKLNTENGVKIVKFDKDYESYWKNNGIDEGSIITKINDTQIHSVDDLKTAIKNRSPYEPLRVELINTKGEKERYNFR